MKQEPEFPEARAGQAEPRAYRLVLGVLDRLDTLNVIDVR